MASAYILPLNLKSNNRNDIIVCQRTRDHIISAKWGKRYEPYFYFGSVDGSIWAVINRDGFGLFPDWRANREFISWFLKKIQSLVNQDKNNSYPPLKVEWDSECKTPLPSFDNLSVGEVYTVYNKINLTNEYRSRTIEESDILPLPDINAPVEAPAEAPQANSNEDTPIEVNEVRIMFDSEAGKLRAKGNDGEHGELWVRFPTDLRIENAVYRVGGLEYAEGSHGKGFYKVKGYIQRTDVEESLTEAINEFKKVVADAYDHFTSGLGRIPTVSDLLNDITDNYEGYGHIQDTPESTRKWYAALVQELYRQGLETTVEESFLTEALDTQSYYDIDFEFTYPGEDESETYFYYIPEKIVIEAVRRWFSDHEVEIDGTDNHVWNICGDIAEVFGDDGNINDLMEAAVDSQADWIREQCKEAAWDEFVDDWKMSHEEDEVLTEEGTGRTTYYSRATRETPEEWEGAVISDYSGEYIEDEDDTFGNPDGEVGSFEEVKNDFMEHEVEILEKGSEKWELAKQYMIDHFNYKEGDFEKAQLVELSNLTYEDMDTWDVKEVMDRFDYHHVSWDRVNWDSDADDYYD